MSHVCAECFDDLALRQVVTDNADEDECSFCGASGTAVAAPLEAVVQHIESCVREWYDDAVNVVFYDNEAPRGYAGQTWTTDELVRDELELDLPRDREGSLFWAIVRGLGDDVLWSDADPAILPEHEELRVHWEDFCRRIRHHGRFFLLSNQEERAVLEELGRRCVQFGLVTTLPAGTKLLRARRQQGRRWTTPAELGPPPDDLAVQSNRMSPPGISLFYAAEDEATALYEMQLPGTYALGEFELLRPAAVLDLTRVPPVPSFFDVSAQPSRSSIIFLARFAREVSRPIKRDDRINLEYIPTQVVTEYFRREFQPLRLLGIRYASAQKDEGICTALFAGATAVVDGHAGWTPEPEGRWLTLVRRWQRRLRRSKRRER